MRVLIVIDSLAVGGAEMSLATLAPHLIERGVDLHVAHLVDRMGVEEHLRAASVPTHSLAVSGTRLAAIKITVELIRELQPDLIHTTLFEADVNGRVAGRLTGVPVVSSVVSEPYGPGHVHNPEYRAWKVRAAQLVDVVTARSVVCMHSVSAHAADVMARRLMLPRSAFVVIPRARDSRRLGDRTPDRRERVRRSLGIEESVPLVVAAGRHFRVKGLDILVEAFADVLAARPTARLMIAGREGPHTPYLRNLITELGLDDSVLIAGFRDDVPDLLCAADVFAFPSRSEGSPGAVLEAMALRTPVVASDIPALSELAGRDPTTLLLTELGRSDLMARGIVSLLEDASAAAALAQAAHDRFVSRYTVEVVADAMFEFYERCASQGVS